MKQAPFYVGQKIVRTGRTVPGICTKGETYTTAVCIQCPDCKDWKVNCTEFPKQDERFSVNSCSCGCDFDTYNLLVGRAELFAPVEENHYEDVTKELAKLPQDEVPDVRQIKELV